jgi:hypothetical protein
LRDPDILDFTSGAEDDGDEEADERASERKKKPADGLSPDTRGDEDEIASEQAFSAEDDAVKIPDDFFYDYNDYVSKASVTDDSGLPMDLLTLQYLLQMRIPLSFCLHSLVGLRASL